MSDLDLQADLKLALDVADVADAFTLPHFVDRDFTVDWKTNQTEVTEIDRQTETLIVNSLVAQRPDHGTFGEEHGLGGNETSLWRWVIDPIDGTSGFVRGIPVWASLIALTHDDIPVLGVVSAPALGFRWWGGVGLGAHVSVRGAERSISVSSVTALGDSQVCVTHNAGWDRLGLTERLVSLQQQARRSRGLGELV